jgi:hypothetical protein
LQVHKERLEILFISLILKSIWEGEKKRRTKEGRKKEVKEKGRKDRWKDLRENIK